VECLADRFSARQRLFFRPDRWSRDAASIAEHLSGATGANASTSVVGFSVAPRMRRASWSASLRAKKICAGQIE